MAISALPITMSAVKTEYGGPNTMGSYLRSGSYVPPLTINAGIATALPLSLSSFASTGTDINMDATYSLSDYSTAPTASTVTLVAYNNASLAGSGNVLSFSGTWVGASSAPGAYYECYLEVISGSAPTSGDSYGAWIALTSDRSWTLTTAGVAGSYSGTWRLHIRNAATDVTKDYADVSVSVVTDSGGK